MPQVSPASPDFFDFNFSSFFLSLSLTFTLITRSFGLFIHSFLLYCLSDLQICLPLTLMGYPSPIYPTERGAQICDCSIITMSTTSSTYNPNSLLSPYTSPDTDNFRPGSAEPVGGVARFQSLVHYYRSHPRFTGQSDLLTFFSGDAFNPSLESTVTKGRHMVPFLNRVGTDVACLGVRMRLGNLVVP